MFSMGGPTGDADREDTYAAIGRAISCWEELEINLAGLNSVFVGKPGDLDAIKEFGQNNATFSWRLTALRNSAATYFTHHCCQDCEGDFDAICKRASDLSNSRNNIAHGVVQEMVWLTDPIKLEKYASPIIRHVVATPWYMSGKLNVVSGSGLGSYEINLLGSRFIALANDVHQFVIKLMAISQKH